ncbi:MAG: shikimate dehydrogenase [Dehalococcoidia bacterium CG2_30_46_19]|nr:MAG: shikimate dehydrogenase [Dehalococcoidia bacterium CG2_30_46_19]
MPDFIGLIGYPVKHSISPYFQQAALDYYHLDIRYQLWETSPEKLSSRIAGLREPQNLGANVTTPYKETVLPLLDEVDEQASLIEAVNTIAKRDDKLVGFNTDADGFITALRNKGKFEPEGVEAVILGAGGVARAVCFSLVQNKVGSLTIMDGILDKSKALAEHINRYVTQAGLKTRIAVLPWQSVNSADTFERCQLIVHCTTIGMKYSPQQEQSPLSGDVIPEGILVYDVVFNPRVTPLLQLARKAGADILGGLPMLVYQGAASFELWTGKKAPVDIMFNKAEEVC